MAWKNIEAYYFCVKLMELKDIEKGLYKALVSLVVKMEIKRWWEGRRSLRFVDCFAWKPIPPKSRPNLAAK